MCGTRVNRNVTPNFSTSAFVPGQSSNVSPASNVMVDRKKRKFIPVIAATIFAVIAVVVIVVVVAGGGSKSSLIGSKNGYSSPEAAAIAFYEAVYDLDTNKILTLIPNDFLRSYEEQNDLTQDDVEEMIGFDELGSNPEYYEEYIEGKKKMSISEMEATGKQSFSSRELEQLNIFLEDYVDKEATDGYDVFLTVPYDGEDYDLDNDVYEYDGRWYSIWLFDILGLDADG
jgi:uncharacterized membrane protein YvbJ